MSDRIEELFYQRKFLLFREYCSRQNLRFVSQLNAEVFADFYKQKGVGINKYIAVLEVYNRYSAEHGGQILKVPNKKKYQDSDYNISAVNPILLTADFAFLECLGFSRKQIRTLIGKQSKNFGDVLNNYSDFNKKTQAVLDKYHKVFCLPTKNLIVLFMREMENYPGMDIFVRRVYKHSLQEIGDDIGITRERVRQVSQKVEEKICFIAHLLFDYLYEPKKVLVTTRSIKNILSEKQLDYIIYSVKRCPDLNYLGFAKAIVNQKDGKKISDFLFRFAKNNLSACTLKDDVLKKLESELSKQELEFISPKLCLNYYLTTRYHIKGEYLVRNNVSYSELVAEIVKTEFPSGVSLYDSDVLDDLRRRTSDRFPKVKLPKKDRALTARLAEILVLSDRGKYSHIDNMQIDFDLLAEIASYLKNSDKNSFIYHEIYQQFSDELSKRSNVINHHAIHGLLKYYYQDDFIFERDLLHKKSGQKQSIAVTLEEYIKKETRPLSFKELQDAFPGITQAMIFNAVLTSKGIIQWDSNFYHHLSNIDIQESEKEIICKSIEKYFRKYKGYCSDYLLYTAIEKKAENFLERNQITNQNSLYYIVTKMLSQEYDFRRPHIYRKNIKDSEKNGVWAAINAIYKKTLNYQAYIEFAKNVGWTAATTYNIFYNMLPHLFRISEDEYLKLKNVKLSAESKLVAKKIIEKELDKNDYFALAANKSDLKLIEFDCPLNGYLLESIISNFMPEYRFLEAEKIDRRFLRNLVVKADSPYQSYEELVLAKLKNQLYNGISKAEVLKLLDKHCFYGANLSDKLIAQLLQASKQ